MKNDDVIGYWRLTEESSQLMKYTDAESKENLISKFRLKPDSSAIITFGDSVNEKEITGTWKWNVEKQSLQNSLFLT